MATYLGLDGGIGRLQNPDYSAKAFGTKVYTQTFGRMGIDGGIIRNARSYAGKEEFEFTLDGAVTAENATMAGIVTKTAFRTISGSVTSEPVSVSGTVISANILSGAVSSEATSVSGTLESYPQAGYSFTYFTSNYADLSADSPFAGDSNYSDIVIGDACHYETLTTPDSHTMTMSGDGEFSISPSTLTQNQTFDFQIYDASDKTLGTTGTITVQPGTADSSISGGVTSGNTSVSGTVTTFTVNTVSGNVQPENATMFGVLNEGNTIQIFGSLSVGESTVSGDVDRVITLFGSVTSETTSVSGAANRALSFSGAVQSQVAQVSGIAGPPIPYVEAPSKRTMMINAENRVIIIESENRTYNVK